MSNLGVFHPTRPLRWSSAWMLGTFGAFLIIGEVDRVGNLALLSLFVAGTWLAFYFGYKVYLRTHDNEITCATSVGTKPTPGFDRTASRWLLVSGIYFVAYSAALMQVYGIASIKSVTQAIISPGEAYAAKFEVYEHLTASGTTSLPLQLMNLVAILQLPLIPFLVCYWRRVTLAARIAGSLGTSMYIAFFLSIGTQQGLGLFLILAVVSLSVARERAEGRADGRLSPTKRRIVLIAVGMLFASYMTYAQASRAQTFETQSDLRLNPVAAAVLPPDLAAGATRALGYPTHGYLGLSLNLESPFRWTKMRGSSRAIDSYWVQYVGGPGSSVFTDTYPARTEVRTGWPADLRWATIYPWLASDLTWFGAIAFMFLVGWLCALYWVRTVVYHDKLALLALSQLGVLIAFIPANNQLFIGRNSLIALTQLLLLLIVSRHSGARGDVRRIPMPPHARPSARR